MVTINEELHKVKILRRTRATGGALLLPGKTYSVSKADFMDLIRCGKGEDPTGEIKVSREKPRKRNHGELPGGEGESTQTVGSSRPRRHTSGESAGKAVK